MNYSKTYAEFKIPAEFWAHRYFLFHKYFETHIIKVDIAHVTFPDMKRHNQWYENKELGNGITLDPLPLPITVHIKTHYPSPHPLEKAIIAKYRVTMGSSYPANCAIGNYYLASCTNLLSCKLHDAKFLHWGYFWHI